MNSISAAVPYTQVHQSTVVLGGQQIELVTKPGLPGWNTSSPSIQLFIEHAAIEPACSILLYGSYAGALASRLALDDPRLQVSITDRDHTSLALARLTLEANHIEIADIISNVDFDPARYDKYQVVFIQLPKGRQLLRRWLVQAYQSLVMGGTLYLAGANNLGIQSAIRDAYELFGNHLLLAYKKGNRIARFIKHPDSVLNPAWACEPGIAPGTWCEFDIALPSHTFHIRSLPGVFSYERLDEGTRMLLDTITIRPGATLLDAGCGYGIIGMYATLEGASQVHLVDTDLLAVASCVETLTLNNIVNAKVFASDLLESVSSNRYDQILSNPPFHSGHAVDYQIAQALITQAHLALLPGGDLTIVANRFIRYDRLIKSIFGDVTTLADPGKYHVISGLKSR
jgi:16S rRNA (guanine1207-N2)-methyltransferase